MTNAAELIDDDEMSFVAPELSREEARKRLEALRGKPLDAPSRLAVVEDEHDDEPGETAPAAEEPKPKAKAPAVSAQAVAAGMYRPVKVRITTRLDADVLAAFKATGAGWQTLLNDVLRKNMPGS